MCENGGGVRQTRAAGSGPVPTRIWAAAALGRILQELDGDGDADLDDPMFWDPVLEALVPLLGHDDPELRWQVADALPVYPEFLKARWLQVLDSGNEKARLCAVWALRAATERDPKVFPLFVKAARDPSTGVRNEALLALSAAANPEFLPFLAEAFESEDKVVRQGEARRLERAERSGGSGVGGTSAPDQTPCR